MSWTHNLFILGKCKREEEREFYLRLAVVQKWTSRELPEVVLVFTARKESGSNRVLNAR